MCIDRFGINVDGSGRCQFTCTGKINSAMSLFFRDIDFFLATSSAASRFEAAAALGVTEAVLGRAIQRVEDEFGLALFVRHARGVRLTPEGEKVVGVLQQMSIRYSNADRVIAEMRAGSHDPPRAGCCASKEEDTPSGMYSTSVIRTGDDGANAQKTWPGRSCAFS